MATSHLIVLPAQELSALLCAADAPQYAALFALLPAFRAALRAPVDDVVEGLADWTVAAIDDACRNTNHPEDWKGGRNLAGRLKQQLSAQAATQAGAPARPAPKHFGNTVCPCCAGARIASLYSKACDHNYFQIPHLGFEAHGYMPSKLGIPGSGDGPEIEVCLDCGRIVNGEYPLPEDVLKRRVEQYKGDRL